MKIGYEVEGRHKGLPSFFVDETELDMVIENIDKLLNNYQKVRHLYATSDNPNADVIKKLEDLSKYFYITIEVKNINFEVPKNIHIMLNISNDDVWKLKESDSVKFHQPDNHVLATPLETMHHTQPEAFLNDKIIKL